MPVYTSSIEVTADYPTIKPSLNLNFARSRALDPRITFTRASAATYVGRDGLIKTAGVDKARFDHDPETLESLGLLIEESRTNQISYSIVSDGPQGWPTVQNVTFSIPTDVSAPDGSISDNRKMIAIATNTSHSTYKLITTGSNGQTHTFSVYMKSAGSDYGYIYVDTSGGRLGGIAVQFSTGNTAVMTPNGIGTQVATTATAVGNGWYRLSVSGSFSSTNNYYCHIDVGNDLAFSQFTGNGTDGIYVWGAQLEAGSFPTSYIPTSGATATRASDFGSITGESFSSWFNPNEFSLDIEYKLGYKTSNMRMFQITNGLSSNAVDIVVGSGGGSGGYYFVVDGGVAQFASAGVSNSGKENTIFRVVGSFRENNMAAQSNYVTSGPTIDTNATLRTDYNRVTFYQLANNGDMIFGHLRHVRCYPKAISDAQITLLSQD